MKKLFLSFIHFFVNHTKSFLILAFLSASSTASAQWYWQNPIPPGAYDLEKVKLTDENNAFVIGQQGKIYKTTNGGDTWGDFSTSETGDFLDLSFYGTQYGVIITQFSVLKTTDAGLTWLNILNSDLHLLFNSCFILDSLNIYISGRELGVYDHYPFIMRTTDGGNNWTKIRQFGYGGDFDTDVCFVNHNNGYLLISTGKLYKTVDGGLNWTLNQTLTGYLRSITFCDSLNGIITWDHSYITTNGGADWTLVNSPDFPILDVYYPNPDCILVVGPYLTVYKSTDKGNTWVKILRLSVAMMDQFNGISSFGNTMMICGADGRVYISRDSGENWVFKQEGQKPNLTSVSMSGRLTGVAVGRDGNFFKTNNGGATWTYQSTGLSRALLGISYINSSDYIAVGKTGAILKISEFGECWREIPSGLTLNINDVAFLNSSYGIAVGDNGTILKTTDAGENWNNRRISDINLLKICLLDSLNIFVYGKQNASYYILRSTDSGLDWDTVRQVSGEVFFSLSGMGTHSLIATGSFGSDPRIIKSSDRGDTWIVINPPFGYNDCTGSDFADSLNGLICSATGVLYKTTNGGNSWSPQGVFDQCFTSNLTDISMVNTEEAVAVGWCGTIASNITSHIMPVELISFSAYAEKGAVQLKWTTATEINNLLFEVQRKAISENYESDWITIGTRKGNGTTTFVSEYTYTDVIADLSFQHFRYRLKQNDYNGNYSYSETIDISSAPSEFNITQNFPNPFNPTTKIRYSIPVSSRVVIKIYDVLGNEVEALTDKVLAAGNYESEFNGSRLSSGVYFYRIITGEFSCVKKMQLIK